MKHLNQQLGGLLLAALASSSTQADVFGPIGGAFGEAKPIVDARLRFEDVDQAPLSESAQADTFRLRLGFETGKAWNTSLLAEAEAVAPLSDQYRADNSRPQNAAYPVIADRESYEINRLQLVNTSIPGTTLTVGRQRILLDDQRFVGNSGWRQNEQTFDGMRVVNKSLAALTVDVTYLNQVNRVYGPDSPQGRYEGDIVLANLAYQFPVGKLAAFSYLLDFDPLTNFPGLTPVQAAPLNPIRVSSQTYGARFSGERALRKLKIGYVGSYAEQRDYGSNPSSFDLDYYALELSATYRQCSLALGQEVMEGNGRVGFSTPLATLHRFHGWADKFLTTPANGIDDRYLSLGYTMKAISVFDTLSAALIYRDFESQRGVTDLGSEVDVQVQARYRRFQFMLKYADYDAKAGATPVAYRDTTKFWAQVEYSL